MELESVKIDKQAVERRFGASAASYDRYAVAQQHIYRVLEEKLAKIGCTSFDRVLEIGCGTGGFSKYIDERYDIKHWSLNDLGDEMIRHGNFRPRTQELPELLLGDAEILDLGLGYDLIISSSAIQWFHDPKRFISSLKARLNPGGILLLSTFGPENLIEMRRLTGRGLKYTPIDIVKQWLSHYEYQEISEEIYPLHFASPREVLLHLKRTGVTAVGSSEGFWSVERLKKFEREYCRLFSASDGGVLLSYHPIYILAR